MSHELVLVSVHASQLTNVCKGVLKSISQLKGINIAQTILDVRVDDKLQSKLGDTLTVKLYLGEAQNLANQVKGISEARFLSLFGSEGLDWLQVEVVVQVKVVEILSVNQQVEHVVALAADLQPDFNPVKDGRLKELGRLKGAEQVALLQWLWWAMLEGVENKALQQLLVGDADLHGHTCRAVLGVP